MIRCCGPRSTLNISAIPLKTSFNHTLSSNQSRETQKNQNKKGTSVRTEVPRKSSRGFTANRRIGYFTKPEARILLALPAWPKATMRATQMSFIAARAGFM